jgi:acetyl/propionyl-CoA carboxylase alpha subunit/acetyl-CoA carboxylase carboxyltransferase component
VTSFTRLAIVNRGEAAMRAIHAVRELNDTRDEPIRVIALYSEPERHALFVRQADERHCIGPPSAYLDYPALERALVATGADAAWVGWGFVAEHPAFAELCQRLGIAFAGPTAEVMRALGDKIEAKRLAERAGVPVAPWSGGPVDAVEDARRIAATLGFPLMIKAAAGGGGRGMRRVENADEVANAYERARAEAGQAFGDDSVLMERLVEAARHVEVQLMADGHGGVWALGVRDCSYQRRHQKVVEESASPVLTVEQERELAESAARLARDVGYRGAGTVEFLYEPESRKFSFMEVNARLQVEHPVTEVVTGADLVALQLQVAAGGRLEGDPPPPSGHAIEVRLNAEDPARGFSPAPGRISLLRLPTGPGIRVDTGFAEGDTVPPDFDSMLAKIIAHGKTREQAIARLRRAVADTMVVIDEGTTNQGFLLELLGRSELRAGEVDTAWLDRLQAQGDVEPVRHAEAALVQAAIALCDEETAADRAHFYALARRGRPQAEADVGHTLDLLYRGDSYRFAVWETGPRRYRVEVDGAAIEADVEQLTEHERRLTFGGRAYRTLTAVQDADLLVEVNGVPHRVSRDEGGLVRSHAPGVVVAIPVSAGDEVQAGDVVAVTESMKMETSLTAPVHGRVREVLVGSNVHVAAGRPLLQIEPLEDVPAEAHGERVTFDSAEADISPLERLKWLVLGYDVTGVEVPDEIDADGEHRLLELYADVRAVDRPTTTSDDDLDRSPQEYLHAFLRSLDAAAEGLPERFVAHLERALAHYGIGGLDRTAALEVACHRLFLAQQRANAPRAAVRTILARRLELQSPGGEELRAVLDRLESALGSREPALAELVRELRWRCCDEPMIEAVRQLTYAAMAGHLAALAEDPRRPDRDERMAALVNCAQPLAPLLGRQVGEAGALVEAMTRRYYRIRRLDSVEQRLIGGVPFVHASYEHDGVRHNVAATIGDRDDLAAALRALADAARELPGDQRLLADLYLREGDAVDLDALVQEAELPGVVARIAFVLAPADTDSPVDVATFHRGPEGWAEEPDLRGMHPMMGARMDFWRLSNFELERVPSAPEIHLFRAVARENPRDERLVALGEVRDLSPVRDGHGRITALPQLEHTVRQAFESMRSVQSGRRPRERLLWNRLVLYVWPPMDFGPEAAGAVIERFTRMTAELGIEMVMFRGRIVENGVERERVLRLFNPAGRGVTVEVTDPPSDALQPLDEGAQRIVSARRRGTLHPAEIVKLLARDGDFVEHDLDEDGELVPVNRPPATNRASIVAGLIRNRTERHPDGMLRVILLGDPTRSLGSLAEPECRRIIAALDLATQLGVPCEWFAVSSGAKIAMDSGTENMDWVAAVLRRIVQFTQAGGEINVVVSGINVGAQPYFNAEATMLMHTRGILVMTPQSAMVLTGKQALDYSGGVSADDNFGIGGYERIMGPNGQAQYWAGDLAGACELLLRYYEHTYVAPGERFPRRVETGDPVERDVRDAPHEAPDSDLRTVGEIFAEETNPGRKKAFDIRSVMRAVADADHPPLERWAAMREAEVAAVWDVHLGGRPVAMIGIESRPLPRFGPVPADGPDQWTSGTLFPQASKKVARAINAASGRRPLVILANLAGFDGSPESMRRLQLEYGAEIGRAIVNFEGPIAFCVISRFHGGAFVVFSKHLNPELETIALEGSHASVIGGAPAAAVVFAREVDSRTREDARIDGSADEALYAEVRAEKMGELAAEFDAIHSVSRAVEVGSVDRVISAAELRPHLIETVERGIERTLAGAQPVAAG